ncbi:MAG TPA: hypothetical protein VJY35_08235 [Candidatus Eisenbacteria bacterium]|nr:hypothetical protein [Candidatus Eisenbacteria bacterium]
MGTFMFAVLVVIGPAAYAALCVDLGRNLLRGRVRHGHNEVLIPIFLNAGVLFAVVLGFMVIAVWESYDAAKTTVAVEAATLVPLYRATYVMPSETGEKLRAMARDYAKAVVEDEWRTQAATGEGSLAARRAMGGMFRAFGDGTISNEMKRDYPFVCETFMNAVNEVTAARNKRHTQANESLPWAMWLAAIGGAFIVITMSCLIYMETRWPHVVMAGAMASLIGVLLFTCEIMSHPFSGPLAISAEPFESALQVFQDVDRGD